MNGQEKMAEVLRSVVSRVQINYPMKRLTTMRVGGPAAYVVTPSTAEQVKAIIQLCQENGLKFFIMGKGSNILASDEGFQGVIIKLESDFQKIRFQNNIIEAECGASLSALAKKAADRGLSGLEFASGIPGSLGGAIYMNAGAYGGEMKDIIQEVTVMDTTGAIRHLDKTELALGYRSSIFQSKSWIILRGILQLEEGDPERIKLKIKELAEKRVTKQPLDLPSAGSVFKRPEGYYAAALIEEAGLKGHAVGGAMVSPKHAGFIVNTGEATCEDVLTLIRHIQKCVEERSGVRLVPEVRYLTPRGLDVIR
ncbi:MAG: UDP-N-acetylmuramate dehydrogenase [Lachnospiraceae bacterium]|jgi:UDP-N-acetylmuramate dehydrogenase|nr:UDP-N-acetylmuramate dehydrogenase [Lachnospiraceae bacterium]